MLSYFISLLRTFKCPNMVKEGYKSLPLCWFDRGRTMKQKDNGLVMEHHLRGFLVGGGSVKPRYGLFSESSLRLYFCLPPRTRSRRTPGLEETGKHQWKTVHVFVFAYQM